MKWGQCPRVHSAKEAGALLRRRLPISYVKKLEFLLAERGEEVKRGGREREEISI